MHDALMTLAALPVYALGGFLSGIIYVLVDRWWQKRKKK